MKFLRWFAVLSLVLALAGGASLWVLKRRYPPERIRDLVLARLEPALGRKIRIATVSLGLRGVDLGGVEVSEAPDFTAGTFLKAERLSAGWSLRALRERRLAISELRLEGFDCRLEQDAKGNLNAASLGAAEAPAKPTPGKAKAPPEAALLITVSRIAAERGTLSYKDAAGVRVKLKDVRAEIVDFTPGKEFPGSLSFEYDYSNQGARSAGSAEFHGRVKPDPSGAVSLVFEPLLLTVAGAKLKLHGDALKAADGSVKLTFDPLEISKAGTDVSLQGSAERSAAGAVKVSAKGKLPALTSERLTALGAKVPAGLSLPSGTAVLAAQYADGRATIQTLTLTLGAAKLDARGSVRTGKGKDAVTELDLTVKTSELPLETLQPLVAALATYGVRGKASLNLAVTGKASAPTLSGDGRVAGLGATVAGLALENGALSITFDPKQVKAGLKTKLAGADLTLDLDARDYLGNPDLRLTGKLSVLDIGAWTADKGPAAPGGAADPPASTPAKSDSRPLKSSGKFEIGAIRHPHFQAAPANVEWSLTGIEPGLAQLSGKTTLRVGAGKLEDLKSLVAKNQVAKVALLPLLVLQKAGSVARVPIFSNLEKISFKEITGDYTFDKGLMTVKESHMDSTGGYFTTTGTADLARDQRLNLRIAIKVASPLPVKISGPLAFFVRGTLPNPEVKPDIAAIIKQPGVEQVLEGGKKLGEKLLNDLFKKR